MPISAPGKRKDAVVLPSHPITGDQGKWMMRLVTTGLGATESSSPRHAQLTESCAAPTHQHKPPELRTAAQTHPSETNLQSKSVHNGW